MPTTRRADGEVPRVLPIILRSVEGLPAEDLAGVREVAIAPAVARGHEERLEADGGRRGDAALEEPRDVALAAPDGELAGRLGPILALHPADAHADDGEAVGVG